MRRVVFLLPLFAMLAACGDDAPDLRRVVLSYGDTGRPYMPQPEEVAKQIAGDLEQIGFTVELRKEAWASFLQRTENGQHQMALMGWSADVADADNFLYVLLDKTQRAARLAQNISFYTDETVHKLLEEARYTYDERARAVLYRSAQQRILGRRADGAAGLQRARHRLPQGRGTAGRGADHAPAAASHARSPRTGASCFARAGDAVGLDPGARHRRGEQQPDRADLRHARALQAGHGRGDPRARGVVDAATRRARTGRSRSAPDVTVPRRHALRRGRRRQRLRAAARRRSTSTTSGTTSPSGRTCSGRS